MGTVLQHYSETVPAALPARYDLRQEAGLQLAATDLGRELRRWHCCGGEAVPAGLRQCGPQQAPPLPFTRLRAVAMAPDIATALAAVTAACAAPDGGSTVPDVGASPSSPSDDNWGGPSSPSPEPLPSSPSDDNGGGDDPLGGYGAAVLPSLEAARHDAFMQMVGGAPAIRY